MGQGRAMGEKWDNCNRTIKKKETLVIFTKFTMLSIVCHFNESTYKNIGNRLYQKTESFYQ